MGYPEKIFLHPNIYIKNIGYNNETTRVLAVQNRYTPRYLIYKNRPVCPNPLAFTLAGEAAATNVPPRLPPSGPISIR